MVVRVSGESIDSLVDPEGLIEDIKSVLLKAPEPPVRSSVTYNSSWLGVMPSAGMGFFSVKIVGVYPENPSKGLPLIRGVIMLLRADDGELLVEADAGPATGWRTAAATMIALNLLGYRGVGDVGIIGAGVQAEYHLRYLLRLYKASNIRVRIHSRTPAKALKIARKYGAEVADLEYILRRSDLIITATNSTSPVIKGRLLKPGVIVASVGAPRPVRELDEDTIKRARCVLVDTKRGVMEESDDVLGAKEIVELSQALKGVTCNYGDIMVYKSVGYALFDLAIAIHIYRRILEAQQGPGYNNEN